MKIDYFSNGFRHPLRIALCLLYRQSDIELYKKKSQMSTEKYRNFSSWN